MKKVYIYTTFNRVWHWLQAMLIIFLGLTGFEIHSSYEFFGYDTAVAWHNIAAYSFITLIILAIFWQFISGNWKQYIPTRENITKQFKYYISGIFKNEPHPTRKTQLSKLNPLQKIIYFGFGILVIPVMVISGLFYMFYRYPQKDTIGSIGTENLELIATIHTIGAFCLVIFFIAHIYLTTTGQTPTSNIKAMITGYEELEDEEENQNK